LSFFGPYLDEESVVTTFVSCLEELLAVSLVLESLLGCLAVIASPLGFELSL